MESNKPRCQELLIIGTIGAELKKGILCLLRMIPEPTMGRGQMWLLQALLSRHYTLLLPSLPPNAATVNRLAHLLPDIFMLDMCIYGASQVALVVKNPPANARDVRDTGLIPGSGISPKGIFARSVRQRL